MTEPTIKIDSEIVKGAETTCRHALKLKAQLRVARFRVQVKVKGLPSGKSECLLWVVPPGTDKFDICYEAPDGSIKPLVQCALGVRYRAHIHKWLFYFADVMNEYIEEKLVNG